MNIIEAISEAEKGALITSYSMKPRNRFLKYIKGGVFWEYELIDEKPVFKYDVRYFTPNDILRIDWDVLPVNYFEVVA